MRLAKMWACNVGDATVYVNIDDLGCRSDDQIAAIVAHEAEHFRLTRYHLFDGEPFRGLARQVTIRARPYLHPALEQSEEKVSDAMTAAVWKAIEPK